MRRHRHRRHGLYIFSPARGDFSSTKDQLGAGLSGRAGNRPGIERGEIQYRSFTIEAFFAREPYHTWRKKGFVRNIVQTGQARDSRLPDGPTYKVMDQ
jgi:hypothetical protein